HITDWETSDGRACVVSEFIDGEVLQKQWHQLNDAQTCTVQRALKEFVLELRTLQQPGKAGWIGSANDGPFFDFMLTSKPTFDSPFKNEKEFNDWRISLYSHMRQSPNNFGVLIRNEMSDDNEIVFTHGDLGRQNIIVQVTGEGVEDVRIDGLVDWEQAGWRPDYWDTIKLHYIPDVRGEWRRMAQEGAFPGFEAERSREAELRLISGPPP
ncbi:hypothetical protein C8J56DRAFT_771258, partial [Mycena floridula]